jgi:hypothetical protein
MYHNEHLPDLKTLAEQIKDHWKQFSPQLYRELKKEGELDRRALSTASRTHRYCETLEMQGYNPLEAWSEAMREVALQTYDQ